MKQTVMLLIVLFLIPLTASAQDFCEGNFDYDDDQDGSDAVQFKEDFGRMSYDNPCPPDGPAPVPKTGQRTSYETGDDGDLERGVYFSGTRFVDNGDETVTDNLTGLMWTKNAQPAAESFTWDVACDYIALANLWHFLGYDDWRLPNAKEMESLVNYGAPTHLDFAPFQNVDLNYYWSSTSFFWNPEEEAFAVLLGDPSVRPREKTNLYHVWPVRGGH